MADEQSRPIDFATTTEFGDAEINMDNPAGGGRDESFASEPTWGDDTFSADQPRDSVAPPERHDDGGSANGQGRADGDVVSPPKSDWFTDDLAARAAEYGLPPEAARQYGSAENLSQALDSVDQQIVQQHQWQAQQYAQMSQQPPYYQNPYAYAQQYPQQQPQPQYSQPYPQQPLPQQQMPQQPQQQQPPVEAFSLPEGLTEDQYGEELVDGLKGLVNHYNQEISRIRQSNEATTMALVQAVAERLSGIEGRFQSQHQQEVQKEFFGALASLPDEVKRVVGDSPAPYGSPQAQAQQQLMQGVDVLWNGHMNRTGRAPSMRTLVNQAVKLALPQLSDNIATQRASNQLRDRQGRFTSPPNSQSSGIGQAKADSARAFIRNFLAEKGVYTSGGTEINDGF